MQGIGFTDRDIEAWKTLLPHEEPWRYELISGGAFWNTRILSWIQRLQQGTLGKLWKASQGRTPKLYLRLCYFNCVCGECGHECRCVRVLKEGVRSLE